MSIDWTALFTGRSAVVHLSGIVVLAIIMLLMSAIFFKRRPASDAINNKVLEQYYIDARNRTNTVFWFSLFIALAALVFFMAASLDVISKEPEKNSLTKIASVFMELIAWVNIAIIRVTNKGNQLFFEALKRDRDTARAIDMIEKIDDEAKRAAIIEKYIAMTLLPTTPPEAPRVS